MFIETKNEVIFLLKKIVFLLLIMISICTIGNPVISSASMNTLDDNECSLVDVIPYWTMIVNVSNGLEINASGNALMVSQITGYSGQVDSIRISAYLQRYQMISMPTVSSRSAPGINPRVKSRRLRSVAPATWTSLKSSVWLKKPLPNRSKTSSGAVK